jgi:hypothetical protein
MILLWISFVWLFNLFHKLLVKGHSVQTNEPFPSLEDLLFPMLYGLCHEFGLGRLANASLLQLLLLRRSRYSYQEVFNEIVKCQLSKLQFLVTKKLLTLFPENKKKGVIVTKGNE